MLGMILLNNTLCSINTSVIIKSSSCSDDTANSSVSAINLATVW